jgi:hypothetical protein
MSDSEQAAAPESGLPEQRLPPFEELAADPEIAALLEFDPAPRKNRRKDGWTPPLQKRFVAYLAYTGSPTKAAEALSKNRHGVEKVYKSDGADSFRAAWDAAVALFIERDAERIALEHAPIAGARPPFVDGRRKWRVPMAAPGPQPGQVLNEFGEWEDEGSVQRRAEDARDSICRKLLNCRRLFLQAISGDAGKRAAFEILTELPIDWDKAERLEAQPDEPWNRANMRQPDMVLTAESGWSFGEGGYGPDKKAAARAALDRWREEQGLEPIDWDGERSESAENSEQARSAT